ncbi:MAG: glucosaminidase domain-containing protein [Alphaproteobacteria bacterium]|nr:glucosaminidase domain-containing protein [Alphaproteobacteria bacterium]
MQATIRLSVSKNVGLYATIVSIVLMVVSLYGMVYLSIPLPFFGESDKALKGSLEPLAVSEFQDKHISDKEISIDVKNVSQLRALYEELEFDLFGKSANLNEVPRVYLTSLPKDLKKLNKFEDKKQLFVQALLPCILAENERIIGDRERLLEIRSLMLSGFKLAEEDQEWLAEMIQRYKLKELSMDELIARVDFIPPSLALGQAILETGWGVSFAALEKNSPFGYTIKERVKFYESLQKSVEDYIINLNTHNAYRKMRSKRAQLRVQKKPICSFQLVDTLHHYSELGGLYISRVKDVMKRHGLEEFDQAQLVAQSQTS